MPLDRDDVLEGAIRLINDEGLGALTMRRLADALDVQAGAIYWHFANKQALYDAMGDSIMAGIVEPELVGAWDVQIAEICRRIATSFLRVRDGATVATLALRPGPNGLAVSEKMLAIAAEAGFSPEESIWATSALGYYVLGWVTDIQATEAAKQRGLHAVLREFRKTIDRQKYPHLADLGDSGLEQLTSSREFKSRFDFGLEVILTGLRATLRKSGRARKRVSKPRKPRRRR